MTWILGFQNKLKIWFDGEMSVQTSSVILLFVPFEVAHFHVYRYWEANLRDRKPTESNMEGWIRSKYEQKRWAMKGPIPDPSTLGGDDDNEPVIIHLTSLCKSKTYINHRLRLLLPPLLLYNNHLRQLQKNLNQSSLNLQTWMHFWAHLAPHLQPRTKR